MCRWLAYSGSPGFGAVYQGIVAARRRGPVVCIRVNVIAIRCSPEGC
jgi:hypothetical protein